MSTTSDTKYNYKKYIVDPKNYKNAQKIQSGGFGSVFKVQDIKTGEKIAAKIINLDMNDPKCKQMANREILIMIRCQHPTIIKFIGYSFKDLFDQKNITIFMEFAEEGSLANLLKNVRKGTAPDKYNTTVQQIILIGIARGMMHLHEHHVIHCDLKPGNVLLDSDLRPHLTDFGLSKIFEKHSTMSVSGQMGTYPYMAPELINDNKHNGKIDVYSFGILMYEVITGSIPYPLLEKGKMTIHKFTTKVVNENYRPEFNFPIKKSLKNLIERCWSKEPKNRPTFEELFKKLAYNIEDSIIDIYEDHEINDDDDDEEEDEEDNKYYLEDVDVEEVVSYADSIQNFDSSNEVYELKKKLEKLENIIDPLKKENETLKEKLENIIENDINPLKKENIELKKENKEIKNCIDPLKKENEKIKQRNKEIKEKLDDIIENDISQLKKENSRLIKENKKMQDQLNDFIENKIEPLKKQLKTIEEHVEEEIDTNEINNPKKSISINIDKITIQEFNSLEIQIQQHCITKIISKVTNPKARNFFNNINNMLQHILKFIQTNSTSFFKISTKNNYIDDDNDDADDILQNVNDDCTICILSKATELLFTNRSLNSPQYANLLKQFSNISIEVAYPSKYFDAIYNIICTLKMTQAIHINVFITNINKIDSFFQNKKNIDNICIDVSVSSIDSKAFSGCSSLQEISIPTSVSSIGSNSFSQCSSLKRIIIPFSVIEIREGTFDGCSSLVEVEIPTSISSIGTDSFKGCTTLKEITIPTSVKTIGNNAFDGCTSLTQITIPTSISSIEANLFKGCTSLKEIIIPTSVKTIGNNAFNGCTSLTQITIPSSVQLIGENSFYNCQNLYSVTFESPPTNIKSNSFQNCKSLQIFRISFITIQNIGKTGDIMIDGYSLKKKGSYCNIFIREAKLINYLSNKLIKYKTQVSKLICIFYQSGRIFINSKIIEIMLVSNMLDLDELISTFKYNTGIEIEYPSKFYQNIMDRVIEYNQNHGAYNDFKHKQRYSPSNNKAQEKKHFNIVAVFTCCPSRSEKLYGCEYIDHIKICDGVKSIRQNSFSGCSSLRSVSIPESVTEIGSNAFSRCSSLESVSIPKSLSRFKSSAFNGCNRCYFNEF